MATLKCKHKSHKCKECKRAAYEYFNTEFIKTPCCESADCVLTLAHQDSIDKNLWQFYHDLYDMQLPLKDYEDDGSIVYKEITKKLHHIQDIWYAARKREAWDSNFVKLVSKLNSLDNFETPIPDLFNPNEEDLEVFRRELPYFGIIRDDPNYFFSKNILFSIVLDISGIYATLEEFSNKYSKLLTLKQSGKYPKSMDEPDVLIQKIVFKEITKDITKFLKKQ